MLVLRTFKKGAKNAWLRGRERFQTIPRKKMAGRSWLKGGGGKKRLETTTNELGRKGMATRSALAKKKKNGFV